jgi:hypothetical protein
MKWEKQTLALAICVVFLVAMTGVTIAATGAEISGEPDFTKVVKQPLSESIVNPEASTVLVAVAANDYSNTLEHDALVSTLNSLGYNTIDVTTVAEAQAAGADVIFAYVGCYIFDIAELNNWISSGKGYIQLGDWTDWFTNSWEYIGEENTVTVTITDPSHPIAAGLPASWLGRGYWAYGYPNDCVGWSTGYDVVGTLQAAGYSVHNGGISVTTYGSGRAVYYGFNLYGAAAGPNELQLLSNIVNWVAQVQVQPSVAISTDSFEYAPGDTMTITLDVANPTEESVMFQWYWGVPQFSVWVPVMSAPIPADYDDTHDFSFTLPNWGPTPFGNVFYVHLLDAGGEVLDADCVCWAYMQLDAKGEVLYADCERWCERWAYMQLQDSGGEAMPAVDIGEEIMKTIERVESP